MIERTETFDSIDHALAAGVPTAFTHNGSAIVNPWMDEHYQGRVDPVRHYGFSEYETGGGLTALRRETEEGDGYLLLTDIHGEAPPRGPDDGWMMGEYDAEGEERWMIEVGPGGTVMVRWLEEEPLPTDTDEIGRVLAATRAVLERVQASTDSCVDTLDDFHAGLCDTAIRARLAKDAPPPPYGISYDGDAEKSYCMALDRLRDLNVEVRTASGAMPARMVGLEHVDEEPFTWAVLDKLNEDYKPTGERIKVNIWETVFHVY